MLMFLHPPLYAICVSFVIPFQKIRQSFDLFLIPALRQPERCRIVVDAENICYTQCQQKSLDYVDTKNSESYGIIPNKKAEERRHQAYALLPKRIHAVCPPHQVK